MTKTPPAAARDAHRRFVATLEQNLFVSHGDALRFPSPPCVNTTEVSETVLEIDAPITWLLLSGLERALVGATNETSDLCAPDDRVFDRLDWRGCARV